VFRRVRHSLASCKPTAAVKAMLARSTVEQLEQRVSQVLVVNSSVSRENSVSRLLVEDAVARLSELDPTIRVTRRDLADGPVPHLTSDSVSGVRGVPSTEIEFRTQALSDELIDELRTAQILVIGAPMYNFSIPTTLRAWFDHVLRPRVTFTYSESGPKGLLTDKHAIVIQSRGGLYSEGPAKAIDFQEPYLRQLLGFIGITDVTFVHAEKIGFGPEARELALETAKARIAAVAVRVLEGGHEPVSGALKEEAVDFDRIMQANLRRVFNERDPSRRLEAMHDIYHEDAVLNESDRSVQGAEAISAVVSELLEHLPPSVAFTAIRPAAGHHGVGRLQWQTGEPGEPGSITGLDVAQIQDGRIRTLHVFLDRWGG
jgi:FMN-dependent NADH-azoreductase